MKGFWSEGQKHWAFIILELYPDGELFVCARRVKCRDECSIRVGRAVAPVYDETAGAGSYEAMDSMGNQLINDRLVSIDVPAVSRKWISYLASAPKWSWTWRHLHSVFGHVLSWPFPDSAPHHEPLPVDPCTRLCIGADWPTERFVPDAPTASFGQLGVTS